MKNILIILTLFLTTHFFNNLQAQAKIDLVNTTGGDGINDDKTVTSRLHMQFFKALSRDDCESAITLTGKIEIVSIPESWESGTNKGKSKTSFGRKGGNSRRSQPKTPQSLTSKSSGEDEAYHLYEVPPVTGNSLTFDTSEMKTLDVFGRRFFVIFTFEDIDECTQNGRQPIDLNPTAAVYESLKLYANFDTGEVRLANNDELTGIAVGETNKYFTIGGNPNLVPNVEAGEIRIKISRKKNFNGPGNLENNGG